MTSSITIPRMQVSDRRGPAADDRRRKQAPSPQCGRWCVDFRLWDDCMGEWVFTGLSQSRSVCPSACNPTRQPGKRTPPCHRWARNRNGHRTVRPCSHRARARSFSAFDTVFGCGTTPRDGCRFVGGGNHCGDDYDRSSSYPCMRDDTARRTRRAVDVRQRCGYHDRRLLARLRPAPHHQNQSTEVRRRTAAERAVRSRQTRTSAFDTRLTFRGEEHSSFDSQIHHDDSDSLSHRSESQLVKRINPDNGT